MSRVKRPRCKGQRTYANILRVNVPHNVHRRAKRACIFKCFLIFLLLEYRKLTTFVLLLGTRRRRKIENHLKSAARRVFVHTRYKTKPNRERTPSKYFGDNLNFFFDDEYPEVQERSDFRYSRKRKI